MIEHDKYLCTKCGAMDYKGYFYKNGSFVCEPCIIKKYHGVKL